MNLINISNFMTCMTIAGDVNDQHGEKSEIIYRLDSPKFSVMPDLIRHPENPTS